jgi:alanyl-tRNA synthetase
LTDRLYYNDSYLFEFTATVLHRSSDGLEIELDRTAFYPTSGGQPHDLGQLGPCPVVDVTEQDDRILHKLGAPLPVALSAVEGKIDIHRRRDHMRQHTGQHLLSAVMAEEFGLKTVSFHLGSDYATVDVEPADVKPQTLVAIAARANERILENRSIQVSYEDAATAQGLRKASQRDGVLRIVTIEGIDRSACGGTHVRQTGEVGLIVLGKTEKVRKALRMEFFCGPRALRYLETRLHDAEEQASTLREKLADADKARRKLATELATIEGHRKLAATVPDSKGRLVWVDEVAELNDEAKARLNAFLTGANTLAVFYVRATGAILIGAHESLGLDCGARLRSAVMARGGKGGGNPKFAQGSIPNAEKAGEVIAELLG